MRYWLYSEPASETSSEPVHTILSEKAILAQYWDYWCERMNLVNKEDFINEETCIADWATIHWAVEVTPDLLAKIISAPNPEN